MLRGNLFVDLYRVVRGALRASVESYSIKELERFFGFEREIDLRDANSALYGLAVPLELGDPDAIAPDHMEIVGLVRIAVCKELQVLRQLDLSFIPHFEDNASPDLQNYFCARFLIGCLPYVASSSHRLNSDQKCPASTFSTDRH